MKKIILFLCMLVILCCTACGNSEKPQPVTLDSTNIEDYVFVEMSFGDVDVKYNDGANFLRPEKYYLTCTATIKVRPKGDYLFENASFLLALRGSGEVGGQGLAKIFCSGWRAVSGAGLNYIYSWIDYSWSGQINLDKEGYGETTICLYFYSDSNTEHPSTSDWKYDFGLFEGTVTQK